MNRFIVLAMAVALGPMSAAVAQPLQLADQSVDQMIDALRPTSSTINSMKLRGIRAPGPSTSPQAAPPQSTPAASTAGTSRSLQSQNKDMSSINLNVQFRTNSAQLTPDAIQALDKLGRALSSDTLAPYRFQIVGHTDAPGAPELNKLLSQRRAEAVVDYMVTKYGIARERLDAWGAGSEDPLVPTPNSEVRNRRVQIVNIGA